VNTEGGSIPPPGEGATPATEWAVQYINENLGGIDGHPLELSQCFVRNAEEEGLECAQQFLNDPRISLIAYGAVGAGGNTINAANNGEKLIIAGFSSATSNPTAENLLALYTSSHFSFYAWGQFGREVLGAETNAIIYPDSPEFVQWAQSVQRATEAAGIESTMVPVDPNSTDLVGALTASGAQNADMISPFVVSDSQCIALVNAMHQLGIDENKAVGLSTCRLPSQRDQYWNQDYPRWYYGTGHGGDTFLDNRAGTAWLEALEQYGLEENRNSDWWSAMFGQTLTIARFLNQVAHEQGGVENITPELLAENARAFRGPLLLGARSIRCGKYPETFPTTCADGAFFTKYEGDDVYGSTVWIETPPELQEELGAVPESD
jgi:branched-chain amino acid transport system substrate-binding protein